MATNILESDEVIAKLMKMGFESDLVNEAVKQVGPSLDASIDFIFNSLHGCTNPHASNPSSFPANGKTFKPGSVSSVRPTGKMRQTSIFEHLKSSSASKKTTTDESPVLQVLHSKNSSGEQVKRIKEDFDVIEKPSPPLPYLSKDFNAQDGWEQAANAILQKHFRFSFLKSFQMEALSAWVSHQDCLVLAATGSGKSLCFQIPALLTGKVVVVISPLISLMHDQCLKLSKHGVSACFLGSGQPDSGIEERAMNGMFSIIYVCPETLLRLIRQLQTLAAKRGITLFAIDEAHCISKWGHDFRPDFRRLSVLRQSFSSSSLRCLNYDVPIMALTATATPGVRDDIRKSLCMSKETKVAITSFFRPNLKFKVKHCRTSSPASYERDFRELVEYYTKFKCAQLNCFTSSQKNETPFQVTGNSENGSIFDGTISSASDTDNGETAHNKDNVRSQKVKTKTPRVKKMSVENLEDEDDVLESADDWDVSYGEFEGRVLDDQGALCKLPEATILSVDQKERLKLLQGPIENGPSIIYVPTRKQTISISNFLGRCGVRAAAYNAKLPKSHLRQVHKEFHENNVQVVVATIAFGMGIDKLNVRRVIHYGWPQSLEAYYQEAGRAGRDGKASECILYANLSRMPTLLPSNRSDDQIKQAYKMLSECYRYGMNTSLCRAKMLVEYFGENFGEEKCLMCDVCNNGPPERQNIKEEAEIFLQVISSCYKESSFTEGSSEGFTSNVSEQKGDKDGLNVRTVVSRIREQYHQYVATDQLWWRGIARILEDKGYIQERNDKNHIQIKFPQLTMLGVEFLNSTSSGEDFHVYPEADMLLAKRKQQPYSSFAEWGKGWADPEIRQQHLGRIQTERRPRKRKFKTDIQTNHGTVRGRLTSKFSKLSK